MTSELLRAAAEELANIERRKQWAERWFRHFGCYPYSYLIVHSPETGRHCRPGHGNHGLVKFPRHRMQSRLARAPLPPRTAT